MRDNIRGQSSTAINQAINLSYVLMEPRLQDWKTWIATSLVSLGLGSGLWLAQAVYIPQIASSQTASYDVTYDVTIERQPNETYESLVKRAEAVARAAAANNLARNRQADDISITVVAHNRGAIAPVLNLKVSRTNSSSPNARRDITYFNQARLLLRLEEDLATTNPGTSTGRSNNTNRSSRIRSRDTNSTSSRPPHNLNPGNVRQGFGDNGSFSQPGRVVTPSTSGQSTNNFPSSNFPSGQTGTSNSTSPTGQTLPTGGGLTPQSPSSTPLNTPSSVPNSTSPSGTLTPSAPVAAPVAPQSQPLTPITPNNSNSRSYTNSTGSTPSGNSTTTTTPGIIPSSR